MQNLRTICLQTRRISETVRTKNKANEIFLWHNFSNTTSPQQTPVELACENSISSNNECWQKNSIDIECSDIQHGCFSDIFNAAIKTVQVF